MKGPGLRIEIDVRRAWRCPTCGQNQRWPTDITAPRCFCVRDGVPMKLAEGLRTGRGYLRPELRSVLDRIQGGEEIPRLMPLIAGESDAGAFGGAKSRGRPPRPERYNDRSNEPPRESRPQEMLASPEAEPPLPAVTSVAPPMPAPPPQIQPPDGDDFGAGLTSDSASS